MEKEFPVCLFHFCLCVYGSRFLCRLSFFFVSCCCVPNCVFCFFYAATIRCRHRYFSFIYLLSDYVCVCVSFYYLLCVSVCASSSLILFCCFLFFSFVYLKENSLIYSQLKRKNQQLYYLFFVLVCSYLHGCCVCVWFFSVDYRWVSGCLYFIYLCVCMLCMLIIAIQRKKSNIEQ